MLINEMVVQAEMQERRRQIEAAAHHGGWASARRGRPRPNRVRASLRALVSRQAPARQPTASPAADGGW